MGSDATTAKSADVWQTGPCSARLRPAGPGPRPPLFPVPPSIRSDLVRADAHDLLIVGDFNFSGGTFHSTMHMLRAARAAGLDCALLHYSRYDQDVTRPLKPAVRREAWDSDVRIVAPGETLRARGVIVSYPAIFEHRMDGFPGVEHEWLAVVVNQMAERDRAGADRAYDPARVRANLVECLGGEGSWMPISARVRALMEADPRYPAPHAETWTPLLDSNVWLAREPRWRGVERAHPVIGRHGRDDPLKWPRDPQALSAAYCAGKPCSVRFLGGAWHARVRLPRWPRNWRALPFGAEDVRAFLGDLDIFVHFPDPDYIEEFGRAPMEAMAAGVPVILPPEFEPTFGMAALYATPEEVWPLADRLWRDRDAWEARARAGRDFVRRTCSYDAFPQRLARISGPDDRDAAEPG